MRRAPENLEHFYRPPRNNIIDVMNKINGKLNAERPENISLVNKAVNTDAEA